MQAIILAGGFGKRLASCLQNLPKPMAPIQDKPFLSYVLRNLKAQGFKSVTLSVHYLRETIQDYFGTSFHGLKVNYAIETTALGTGGAIVHALKKMKWDKPIFILNGDTFVQLDFQAMYAQHKQEHAQLTMALRHVTDCQRYGRVVVRDKKIIGFAEKEIQAAGLINAGVYLINPTLLSSYAFPKHFSFEQDFLLPYVPTLKPHYYLTENYFIDIGIPEDYQRAQQELPSVSQLSLT